MTETAEAEPSAATPQPPAYPEQGETLVRVLPALSPEEDLPEDVSPIFPLDDFETTDFSSAVVPETCQGIIGWRYIPWSSWRSGEDRGMLRLGSYMKKRDDTYLKLTFSSVIMQVAHDQCAQW